MNEPQPLPQREIDASDSDDMPTVPIPARKVVTTFDAASRHERIEIKPPLIRFCRRAITYGFGIWLRFSTALVRRLNWYPRVEPYVGYGTEHYSRLICRTVFGPFKRQSGRLTRGIRGMLTIPSPHTKVRIAIDDVPLETVQVGISEVYDHVDRSRDISSEFAASDSAGYLDLVAEHSLEPGIHNVSYRVRSRKPVAANLFTIPSGTKVGVISDVDDTIMVTQAPSLMKAAYNLLLLDPKKNEPTVQPHRRHVSGCTVFLPVDIAMERGKFDPTLHHLPRIPGRTASAARSRSATEDLHSFRCAAQTRVCGTADGRFSGYEIHSHRR